MVAKCQKFLSPAVSPVWPAPHLVSVRMARGGGPVSRTQTHILGQILEM